MARYIRTFYNDEKVIMKLNGCQVCPMMRFDIINVRCSCRYFSNKYMKNNTVNPFVIDYTDEGIVKEQTKPPLWCELPYTLEELIKYRTTYRAFRESILVDPADSCDDTKLDIIDAEVLKNKEDILLDNFLLQLNGTRFKADDNFNSEDGDDRIVNIHRDFDELERHYESAYGYQTSVKKLGACSICGEEDETVKRDKNIGMCDDCWEEYKDDDNKKKQAFINNFRMKRNMDFPKESFKIIDGLNIE
jgi:hypothetical protein